MRAFLHIVAIVLALPQVLLWTAFAILDHVRDGKTADSMFTRAFTILDAVLGWAGVVVLLGTVLLIAAGFSAQWRPFASGAVVLLVVVSTAGIFVLIGEPPSLEGLLLFVPGAIAAAISVRLAMLDWNRVADIA